jgi:pimeloyl-ACP methyl ester carboxylesterase
VTPSPTWCACVTKDLTWAEVGSGTAVPCDVAKQIPSTHPPVVPPTWLPEPRIVTVRDRGEVFSRVHEHTDGGPVLLLLHGWTASADVQFATIYRELMARYSFVAVDHRGHGRGIRTDEPFRLEDAADDAAGVIRTLDCGPVIVVGYSMGGPLALHVADRHPDIVRGMVLEATALSFATTRVDRLLWRLLSAMETTMRSRLGSRFARRRLEQYAAAADSDIGPLVPWLAAEMGRGNPRALIQAGRALRHFDGEPIAARLSLPAAVVVTTHDRSVRPKLQRRMAHALHAAAVEVDGGHFVNLISAAAFASATLAAVDIVVAANATVGLH